MTELAKTGTATNGLTATGIVMTDIVVVVTGAAPIDPLALAAVPPSAIVIAADGALDHALAADLQPAALVGDLDSISASGLAWARENATIQQHPADKNHTDTELALATAADLNPSRLILISGGGDRLDHTLAAIGALGHSSLTSVPDLEAWWGRQRMTVHHGPASATFDVAAGTTLSLLALHGPCVGVSISGVRWPLDGVVLEPVVGLGVSNVTTEPQVTLGVTSGVLTVFFDDPHPPPEEAP